MNRFLCLLVVFFGFLHAHMFADIPTDQMSLVLVKPEAVLENHVGGILAKFEGVGLKVVALKMTKMSRNEAQEFYSALKDRPFYADLVDYMTSGPIVAAVLEGSNVIEVERKIIGATNPAQAAPGTIRKEFGTDITQNAVHGSDSVENAKREIAFFFVADEIFSRS